MKRRRVSRPTPIQRGLETLEDRRLLASVQLTNGSLYLSGSPQSDVAEVDLSSGMVVASLRQDGGVLQRSYPAGAVREIVFVGDQGDDQFTNRTSIPVRAWGGPGNDTLVGGTGNDELVGDAGDDLLVGDRGNDRIWGADGQDVIVAGEGDDIVYGGYGHDQVFGEGGRDQLYGEDGVDRLFGDEGDDLIDGGQGNDYLYGGNGVDRLWGGDGADVLAGDAGADYLNGGVDGDWLYGGAGDDTLVGDRGGDVLYGNSGRDALFGGEDGDWLYGGDDDDWLLGEGGNDVLEGGAGGNYLDGGAGSNQLSNRAWVVGMEATPAYVGLSVQDLARIAQAAEANWRTAGLEMRAYGVAYRLADLPGDRLATTITRGDGTSLVLVDANAAGRGWFVDATPNLNEEYWGVSDTAGVTISGVAADRFDLLTVLHHELGHAAGIGHRDELNVMMPVMVEGMRLLPDRALVAARQRVEANVEGLTADQVGALLILFYYFTQHQGLGRQLQTYNATFGTPYVPGPSESSIYNYRLQRNPAVSRIPAMLNPFAPGNMFG